MLSNIIQPLTEFINSVLAPVPPFARGYVLLFTVVAAFWVLGMAGDDTDDVLEQVVQGIGVTRSGLNRFAEASAPVLASGAVFGGRAAASAATSVGRGVWRNGSSLVEVEEAPIKIGPIVEIYGIRIGLIGLLVGLLGLGGFFVFSGDIPVLP
jgi:hypothetical protein